MAADTTDDGHWILVDGRRWRATDPSIPESFRKELVDELMSARRAVGAAGRAGDEAVLREARARVDDAKRALGERGEPWWEEPTKVGLAARSRATILSLLHHRAPSTICPSDVARSIGGDGWRSLLDVVRSEARALQQAGRVEITQRGEVVGPDAELRGPVRIRLVEDPS